MYVIREAQEQHRNVELHLHRNVCLLVRPSVFELTSKGAVYTAFVAPSRPKNESVTDGRTNGRTNGPTDGRTHAHIESLRRD